MHPRGERQSSEPMNVSLPTPSYTTGTPLPLVISLTRAIKSSFEVTITCLQPAFLASAAFSSLPTVPITVAPRYLHHCESIWPTPPAAACTSTVCPLPTLNVRLHRYQAVMPFNIIEAAILSSTPAGIFTSRATGRRHISAYEPIGFA